MDGCHFGDISTGIAARPARDSATDRGAAMGPGGFPGVPRGRASLDRTTVVCRWWDRCHGDRTAIAWRWAGPPRLAQYGQASST